MWGVKRWGLLFKSLYIFVKLKPQKFCSLHVFTFSSLQLFGKKCVRNTWYILWVCTTYVWHGASGRGLGPGPGHTAIPVSVQADQAEHSLFWASPSFFGPWVCEYSTGWGWGDWFVLDTDTDPGSSLCAWCRPHQGHDCQGLCPQSKTLFKWRHDDMVINTIHHLGDLDILLLLLEHSFLTQTIFRNRDDCCKSVSSGVSDQSKQQHHIRDGTLH